MKGVAAMKAKKFDGVNYYVKDEESALYKQVIIANQPVSIKGLEKIINIIKEEFPGCESKAELSVCQNSHPAGSAFGQSVVYYDGHLCFSIEDRKSVV